MDHFQFKDGVMHAEGVSLETLAATVGTPFYVYSAATLTRHYHLFTEALSPLPHQVCFAIKSLSNVAVLKLLGDLGAGMDVVSGGEYRRARAAGVPGDRIVGLRKTDAPVEVHTIDCLELASGIDADWIDLNWGKRSQGAVGRLRVTLYDRPGTLAEMAGLFAQNHANVVALDQTQNDHPFTTYDVELDVADLAHLTRILSALRASDAVAQAERL